MTAHIVIPEWDTLPITTSTKAMQHIRETFGDWLIISDCLTMGAITGTISERVQNTLDAGVDLALFSNGSDEERRIAVEASGEPRVSRDDPNSLDPLSNSDVQRLLKKLRAVTGTQDEIDPPWDRS